LNEHPDVSQTVVVAREAAAGDLRLTAYLVPASESLPSLSELREFVGARLPDYMVPATFVTLDGLPLTPNGKVDRAALPAPNAVNTIADGGASRGAQTEVEETVVRILAPLLGLERVDVEANFFALGGHSLLGLQLISRVRESLGVELPLRTVFEAPSVVELSTEIERLLCAKLEGMTEDEVQQALAAGETQS
jgi:acyl carrier protein